MTCQDSPTRPARRRRAQVSLSHYEQSRLPLSQSYLTGCFSPLGVIERWELIQAQSLSEKHRQKQNLQQWQQLISDLQTMRAWLGQSEAELSRLRGLDVSTNIHTIQQRIKKLKVSVYFCFCFAKLQKNKAESSF